MAYRALHAVNTAKAGVLEFGHFATAGNRRFAARLEGLVDHALDDDGAGRIVSAGFCAQAEEFHPRGIDIVLIDQANDGRGCHRVDALVRAPHAETAPYNLAHLGPVFA